MRHVALLLITAIAACAAVEDSGDPSVTAEQLALEERGPADAHVRYAKGHSGGSAGNLVDHGGKVLAASNTYAIWWGDPSAFPADAVDLESLLAGLGGSRYLAITNQYMRGATAASSFKGSFTDTSAPPRHGPNTGTIVDEACAVINRSGLTPDPDGLYAVFTSNYPAHIKYCAWHSHGSCNGVDIQVAYLPSGTGVAGCDPFVAKDLGCNNVSQYTRSVADSLAHEFSETITDADISAWYDSTGAEIGDKCNFVYGSCVTLGGVSWQIQEEWSNAANGCVQEQ